MITLYGAHRTTALSAIDHLRPTHFANVEGSVMAGTSKLSVGQVLDKLRSADTPKLKTTRLDEKIETLDQELQRLKVARRRLERDRAPATPPISTVPSSLMLLKLKTAQITTELHLH